MAVTPRAVTVTLYRAGAGEAPPVASSAICVAGFGLVVTIAAALAGATYFALL